jgi:hypothetical protein
MQVTFSTVGYGDIAPEGTPGRIWVIGMIVLGEFPKLVTVLLLV